MIAGSTEGWPVPTFPAAARESQHLEALELVCGTQVPKPQVPAFGAEDALKTHSVTLSCPV